MRALFIGLGSIGRRHLRILRELAPGAEVSALRSGQGPASVPELAAAQGRSFRALDQALEERPDFAVVANPTSRHVETALTLAKAGVPFLLEKPVGLQEAGLEELAAAVAERGLPVLVGLQLRYHPAFAQLSAWLQQGAVGHPLSLQAEVGQWLPDWRPEVDYRASQTARAELGGGVILELVHELDLALACLGPAASVACVADHVSGLEMDAEDLAEISTLHASGGLSQVHLDCIQPGYTRWLKVIGEEGVIMWQQDAGWLELRRPGQAPQRVSDPPGFERDDLFRSQMRHWLAVLAGQEEPRVSLAQGIAATRLALSAKRAAAEQRTVQP
ncbi:MAG: Gfo/Idh/MocA family oxidoreductase [Thermodesulfobacteriota bacterium]